MNNLKKFLFYPLFLFIITFNFIGTSSTNASTVVPHFSFNLTSIILLITFLLFILIFIKSFFCNTKIRFDIISFLLIIRIITIIIPLYYVEDIYAWGNILTYIISFLIYFVIINSNFKYNELLFSIKVFILIMFFQSIFIYINSPVSYSDNLYKYYMVFPIGASNYASSIICIVSLVLIFDNNCKNKFLWYILSLITIFLTKSRTSLLIYVFMPIFYYILKNHRTKISTMYLVNSLIILTLFILIDIIIFMLYNNSMIMFFINKLSIFFKGFIDTSDGFSLDELFSGRISLFEEHLVLASKNPIFGSGLTFYNIDVIFHNFILESFYVNGFLGITITFLIIFMLLKVKNNEYPYFNGLLISVFLLISIEKIAYTFIFDSIFWLICALICKDTNWRCLNESGVRFNKL